MADKQLVYRITVDGTSAKREAAEIRATFTRELKQISLGKLDTSGATNQAKQLVQELNNVESAGKRAKDALPKGDDFISSGIGDAVNQVKALALSYVGLQGIAAAIDLSKLGTQARRTYASLDILSGGGKQTEEVLKAIQRASNGTVSQLEAASIATQGFALKLARTPAEFEKLTRAGREVAQISPIINDVGEALTQLALFASNEQSFARADQLGLSVSEVKDRMAELRRENTSLSGSQAKLVASIELLDEKYGATLDTIEAQATGLEKLRVAFDDARVAFATTNFGAVSEFLSIDKPATNLANILGIITGSYTEAQGAVDSLSRGIQRLQTEQERYFLPKDNTAEIEKQKNGLDLYRQATEEVIKAQAAGAPGANEWASSLAQITTSIINTNQVTDEQVSRLKELHKWYQDTALAAVSLSEAEKLRADNKITAAQFEDARKGAIFEQQPAIESSLAGAAAKAASVVGVERAIEGYRKQLGEVDRVIQELIDSGVSDQNEIAIRVSAIAEDLAAPLIALQEQAATLDFSQMSSSLSSLNAGFVDFLPGVAAARDELATLSEEMMYSNIVTEEQAARFEYLSAVAWSVGDASSQLNGIVGELGTRFLESNTYAAELVNQMFLAEAAFRSGQISSGQYAGIMTILSGDLLEVARTAGVATNAINILNSAQADMSNLPGFGSGLTIGSNIAQRTQTQQATMAREHNKREMERYAKEQERAAKSAAKQTESAAKKAAKELESGAKKAAQELQNALRGVEGLFDPSQVSDEDMKRSKLGIYGDKADEYLRRLRDEVENGKDWADVSIEDAKAALERIGVVAGGTSEAILQQFEDAWASSALFSDKENLSFINKEAVQLQLDLQKKSEEGEKNIFEYFGIKVDEAVDAVTGGGGGGGGYTPPEITPPDLIDVDPLTEGLQTGLDNYIQGGAEAVQKGFEAATALFFDPANLFGKKANTPGAMGPAEKPVITVTADESAQAFVPALTGQIQPMISFGVAQGPMPKPGQSGSQDLIVTPTLDTAAFEESLKTLTPSVSVQLGVTIEEIKLFKDTILSIVKPSVSAKLEYNDEEAFAFTTYLESIIPAPGIKPVLNFGATEASEFMVYLESMIPSPGVGVALGLTIEEIALFKESVSTLVKPTVEVGLALPQKQAGQEDGAGQNAITPLITDLNTQIRASQEPIRNQGITIAQILVAGMIAHLKGGQQATGGASGEAATTPMADAMMTSLSSQFSATQNMFYAVGFLPASSVESGFKGYEYTGLANSFMEKLTTEIRTIGTDLQQRGGTMASYVQAGFVSAFNSDSFKAQLSGIGELMYTYIELGILAKVNGGALTEAIGTKIINDINAEMEQP